MGKILSRLISQLVGTGFMLILGGVDDVFGESGILFLDDFVTRSVSFSS